METIEEEIEVAKDQIAFDLDNIPQDVEEEESTVLPESALLTTSFEQVAAEVFAVLVRHRNPIKIADCNSDMCGRPLIDWVAMSVGGCESVVVDENNLFEKIKALQTNKPYILVLYSDTPTVTKNTVCKVVDYFVRNHLNGIALPRGYMFKTDYLKTIESFPTACPERFDESAFTQVCDCETYCICNNVIRDRIFDYHTKNGVTIIDPNFTIIDADVVIESGVVIHSCNVLKGESFVGKNTTLFESNILVDGIVGENCKLTGCRVYESKLGNGLDLYCFDFLGKDVPGWDK